MKINFIERKVIEGRISIEKVFSFLKLQLIKEAINYESIQNPYVFSFFGILKAIKYFISKQGEINHITGDIHWIGIFLNKNKTILTIHDLFVLKTLSGVKKGIYFLFWVYLPIKRLRYITTVSEKTKDEIIGLLPWAKNKITVIPNCITIDLQKNIERVINNTPQVLIVGTRSNKNLERIIPALKGVNCTVNIVGDLTKSQKELLVENQIDYAIFFNISEDEIEGLYQSSDLLCFVSTYEGFGLPILEAQAFECAVITSNISPMREIAGDGAILVDPNSATEIHCAIQHILKDENFKKELIQKGKKNIAKYLPVNVAREYIKLYKKVITSNQA